MIPLLSALPVPPSAELPVSAQVGQVLSVLQTSSRLGWRGLRAFRTWEAPHERPVGPVRGLWLVRPGGGMGFRRRPRADGDGPPVMDLAPGQVGVLLPGQRAVDEVLTAGEALHVFLPWSTPPDAAFFPPFFRLDDPLLGTLLDAVLACLDPDSGDCRGVVAYLAQALTRQVGRGLAPLTPAPAPAARAPGLTLRQRETLEALLTWRLAEKLEVADLCEAVCLSRTPFLRRFRASYGTTPHQWILAARVRRAQALLATTELSYGALAAACGFASQSHLILVFRRHLHCSPADYRRRMA